MITPSPVFFNAIRSRYGSPSKFVDELAAQMKAHGISQQQLAEAAGYPRQYVQKIVGSSRRIKHPQIETMMILDEALLSLIQEKEG